MLEKNDSSQKSQTQKSRKKSRLFGVIYIGSHSVRLFVGQKERRGKVKVLERLWLPIEIGQDTFSKGVVGHRALKQLIKCLKNFKETLETYQVDYFRAVATSSLREASNSDIVVDRIRNASGIKIDIIEPAEHTDLLFRELLAKVLKGKNYQKKNVFFLVIGAGTTQIVYVRQGELIFSETFHIGTLRMQKIYQLHYGSYKLFLKSTVHTMLDTLRDFQGNELIDEFIVSNDDALNLIRKMKIGKIRSSIGVLELSRNVFLGAQSRLNDLPQNKFQRRFDLNEKVFQPSSIAIFMAGYFFEMSRAKKILFPEINLSTSILWEFSSIKRGPEETWNEDVYGRVLSATRYLGKKYQVDFAHGERVMKNALCIFDHLAPIFGFSKKERVYLSVSSLLHDIGKFVSFQSHHKHSESLVASSEILGLKNIDIDIISQITRYHRRALPKETHSRFTRLDASGKLSVSRLSSILRIADALDKIHSVIVERIQIEVTEDICVISVGFKDENYEHFDLFSMTVKEKSNFFENFFGLKIRIEKIYEQK